MLSLLNSTAVFTYLAVLDFEIAPNIRLVIIAFLVARLFFAFLASATVYIGIRRELAKILPLIGTDIREAKTVQQMVVKIQDGDA